MKQGIKLSAAIIVSLLFFNNSSEIARSASSSNYVFGDSCSYEKYDGVCKIINLYFNAQKSDGKLVSFRFEPNLKLDAKTTKLFEERSLINADQEETIGNFVPADWNQHDKNQLNIGDNVSCQLKIETSGTCTPIIFTMQEILKDQNVYDKLVSQNKLIYIIALVSLLVILIFAVILTKRISKKRKKNRRKKRR